MKGVKRYPMLAAALLVLACGGGGPDSSSEEAVSSSSSEADGLTAFELEHGIGPVTEPVDLGEVDAELAAEGASLFSLKCTACHEMADRYIGPPLGNVVERRSPEYVLNMVLNPEGMTSRHPDARALLAEYMAPMPNQDLSLEEARAVLEYLRQVAAEGDDAAAEAADGAGGG